MSDFRFDLSDRVNVPHFINVQGSVIGQSNSLIEGRRYTINWVSGIQVHTQTFSEAEMAAANAPAQTISFADAQPAKPDRETMATLKIDVDSSGIAKVVRRLRAASRRLKHKTAKKSAKRKR